MEIWLEDLGIDLGINIGLDLNYKPSKRKKPLPRGVSRIPGMTKNEAFVYFYLITGDILFSMFYAGFYRNGVTRKKYAAYRRDMATRDSRRELLRRPQVQKLLREVVNELSLNSRISASNIEKKNKKKIKRILPPTETPEAQIETKEELIATAEEVLEYLTSCMRGSVTEEVLMPRSCGAGEQVIERLRKEVAPRDRTKAAELLAKRYGLLEYKYSIDVNAPVLFKGEEALKD